MQTQSEYAEFTWHICDICGCRFLSDCDPVCDDRACQEYRWAGVERDLAVRCAEQVLDDAWWNYVAERSGL